VCHCICIVVFYGLINLIMMIFWHTHIYMCVCVVRVCVCVVRIIELDSGRARYNTYNQVLWWEMCVCRGYILS